MELKDVLGEIEADGAHLVHGRLLEWALTPPLWHADAVGGRPSHQAPFEASSGFTRVTARWIAQPPTAAFVTRLRPGRLPRQGLWCTDGLVGAVRRDGVGERPSPD